MNGSNLRRQRQFPPFNLRCTWILCLTARAIWRVALHAGRCMSTPLSIKSKTCCRHRSGNSEQGLLNANVWVGVMMAGILAVISIPRMPSREMVSKLHQSLKQQNVSRTVSLQFTPKPQSHGGCHQCPPESQGIGQVIVLRLVGKWFSIHHGSPRTPGKVTEKVSEGFDFLGKSGSRYLVCGTRNRMTLILLSFKLILHSWSQILGFVLSYLHCRVSMVDFLYACSVASNPSPFLYYRL